MLSRELRENYKKSHDIAVAISCIFMSFSCFSVFHPVLMQHTCGDVTMKILEFESKRYAIRKAEAEENNKRLRFLNEVLSGQHSTPEEVER